MDVGFNTYCHKYGGIKNICKELKIQHRLYNEKTREEIISIGMSILSQNGKITKELCSQNGISSCVVKRLFGNFENFFKEIGYSDYCRKNIPIDEVLEDVYNFYLSSPNFSSVEYRKSGKFSTAVINRFGGWKEILNRLGIENKDKRIGFDKIDSELKRLVLKYGTLNRDIVESNTDFTWNCLFWYFENTEELLIHYGIDPTYRRGRSGAEVLIIKILEENKIQFEKEKTFPWLINTNGENLYLDFYFASKNFALEYDGEQHYKNIKYFYKTNENFEKAQNRDRLKEELLKQHNIPLVRISYKDNLSEQFILGIYEQF